MVKRKRGDGETATVTRIGVISDTHGLLRPQALAALEGCTQIIHAGDVGKPQVLEALRALAPLHAIAGNIDDKPWAAGLPQTLDLQIEGVRIRVLHDLKTLAPQVQADVVISGHSHKPRVHMHDGVLYLNPGSAGPRRFSLPISVATLWLGDGAPHARTCSNSRWVEFADLACTPAGPCSWTTLLQGMSMNTRRQFLSAAAAGTAALAAAPLMAQSSAPGSVMPTRGNTEAGALPTNPAVKGGRYRPRSRLGFGGVAIGNGFAPATDAQSEQTLAAVWESGVRYFDTSPWYGLGLSERRTGHHLHNHPADDYVLSTKVGRLLTATDTPPKTMWQQPSPFDYRYDYSASGVRRSIEDSLQRLGVSQIDIAYIHDLSPENEKDLGMPWEQRFAEAVKGAMPELTKMRKEGLIKAWGFGVNRPEPALRAIEEADPDIFLLACQYSLLDHAQALHDTFPKIAKHGASVVVGAPLLAGYLAGRERYLYDGTIPPWAPAKRRKALAICDKHGVDLRTVALQFAAAPQVVSAVIPGARTAEQARANATSMRVAIPSALWEALKREGVIEADAPVPAAR